MGFDVTVAAGDIVKALALADRVVSKKVTIPVLANVLLETADDRLRMTATDIDVATSGAIAAKVAGQGTVTIPIRTLNDLVRSIQGDVRLFENGSAVTISASGFRANLSTLPPADFPSMATPPEIDGYAVSRLGLIAAIRGTRYACSSDDTRYYLNGALFEFSAGGFRVAATDSKRLAIVDLGRDGQDSAEGIIVPRKTLDALLSILEGATDETVVYRPGDNHLFFSIGNRTLMSRRVDGTFPQYSKFVPELQQKRVVFDRRALSLALRRLKAVADLTTQMVVFNIENETATLSAKSAAVGDAEESLRVDYGGPALKFGVAIHLTVDFVDDADTDSVELSAASGESPQIWIADSETIARQYVMQPMRV